MDPLVTSALISTGSSLLGGLLGGKSSSNKQVKMMEEQARVQRGLWEDQIPHLVKGAKAAGLHPLTAVGVNPASGPSVGSVGYDGPGIGDTLNEMGQNISRAVSAYQSPEDRAQEKLLNGLKLERASLENDLLRSQITNVNASTNPAMPSRYAPSVIEGQGDGRSVIVPDEVVSANPNDRGMTAGKHPGFKLYDVGKGRTVELPYAENMAEALEGMPSYYTWSKMAEILAKRYLPKDGPWNLWGYRKSERR